MWYEKSIDDVKNYFNTNLKKGISEKEASKRKKIYGENKLKDKKKENIIIKFIKQFNDFMIIILIVTSIISVFIAKISGSRDYLDSIIIMVIVFFNALMGLIQESKAEKSIDALKKMSSPTAIVKRNGDIKVINAEEVVPGDLIVLEAGKFVPADCRLISSNNLQIEESSLTGENINVMKDENCILKDKISLGDIKNCAFLSTIVIGGHGEAIVTETGMNTKVGKIAKMIVENESPQTPIQKKLEEIGRSLGIICLIVCCLVFIIGIIKKVPIQEMFMTSIGLAVAAIPEGLPAIVTIMLSIGVTKLAKKNVIIRKLPAVETLGSSNIICTDKTGTLTQNKMQVVEISNNSKNDKNFTIRLGTMCTDCSIKREKEKIHIYGDPTEIAIVEESIRNGEDKNFLYKKMKRINDIPFDSDRKLMTTIHKNENKYRIITKGAPDILIKKCVGYYENGKVDYLNNNVINKIKQKNENMAERALRVIAVAYVDLDYLPKIINSENINFCRFNWYDRSSKKRCKRSYFNV